MPPAGPRRLGVLWGAELGSCGAEHRGREGREGVARPWHARRQRSDCFRQAVGRRANPGYS